MYYLLTQDNKFHNDLNFHKIKVCQTAKESKFIIIFRLLKTKQLQNLYNLAT